MNKVFLRAAARLLCFCVCACFAQTTVFAESAPEWPLPALEDSPSAQVPSAALAPSAELVFSPDADSGAVLGRELLLPGEQYRFPVLVLSEGAREPMTEALFRACKVTYTKHSPQAAPQLALEVREGVVALVLALPELSEQSAEEPAVLDYTLKLLHRDTNETLLTQELRFSYGYQAADDAYLQSLPSGEPVVLDPSRSLFSKEQLARLAQRNDRGPVRFSGRDFTLTASLNGEGEKNLAHTRARLPELDALFPGQELYLLRFPAAPEFAGPAALALSLEALPEEFGELHLYRYDGEALSALSYDFDAETDLLSFETARLDCFLVTNRSLPEGALSVPIVPEAVPETARPGLEQSEVLGDEIQRPARDDSKRNPPTGV